MSRTRLLTAAAVLASSFAWAGAASAGDHTSGGHTTLRIATVAPKNSSWGKVFATWQRAIEKKTDEKLKLEVFYNGVQGNEDTMVSKVRTGQLDGAAIGAIGLGMIYKSVLVLQLPGVLTNWQQLDKVRAQIQPRLENGLKEAGFNIVGWGDVGLVRQFTKGFEIRRPIDVKTRRPAVWRNEPVGPALYASIGSIVPVPVDVMEMLPALRSGNVNIIVAPALAAEQLQWTPYLDHVNDNVIACAIGALLFKSGVLESLPPELKTIWDDVQKRASETQQGKIRRLDEEAYGRILEKMTAVKLTQAERDEWEKLLRKVVKGLAHGTYDLNLVNEVLKAGGYDPV